VAATRSPGRQAVPEARDQVKEGQLCAEQAVGCRVQESVGWKKSTVSSESVSCHLRIQASCFWPSWCHLWSSSSWSWKAGDLHMN
jgi:hypothetical protein